MLPIVPSPDHSGPDAPLRPVRHAARDPHTIFRRLHVSDRDGVLDHLLCLSPQDRRWRFGATTSDAGIRTYCDRLDWESAIMLAPVHRGRVCGVAELRPAATAGFAVAPESWAEVALSVDAPCRSQGYGRELVRRLMISARNRSITTLAMNCHLDNGLILRLARHFGARLSIDHGDVEARFRLPGGNPLTFILELWDESEAMWIRPEALS
ncbi:MAG: GNAT family N-acetyltransferase [Geminicoccaceae bacterium]